MRKTKKQGSVGKSAKKNRITRKRVMRRGNKSFNIKVKMPNEKNNKKILDKIKKIFKSGEEYGYVNSRTSKVINQKILSSKGDMYDIQVELKPDNNDPNLIDVKKLKKAKSSDIVKELNRIVTKFKKRGMTEYNDVKFIK
tara:strand:+ start:6975 stop:7394 length:420 start_codon:yes stop_codon:yes gene_type:complete